MDQVQAAQAANEASAPVSTRPETNKPAPKAKATKWASAPEVVGEKEGETGEEKGEEPKGDAVHRTEEEPQTQAVTDTAGTVNDVGPQEGDALQIPARAENDPLGRSVEPASNITAPEAEAPGDASPAAGDRPMDPASGTMFRNDADHPHFANPRVQEHGDYDKSSSATERDYGDAQWQKEQADKRSADLDAREAEVTRREQAAQPQTATITDRDVDMQIVGESYVDGATAFGGDPNLSDVAKAALAKVTLCVLMLRNGGVMIGSAEADGMVAADPQNMRVVAMNDARTQLEAAHRYAHRCKMAGV